MSQVATTATSFLLRNHKTVGLLAIIALLIVIPIPAEANVNFNCQFNFFPDGKPNTFDLGCKIGEIWLGLMSIFAFICGNILDLVVKFFVFEMSTSLETGTIFGFVPTLNGEAQIPVYRQMWFIVRDLANLGFIFILIYAAIATIFKIKGVDYRRVIPQLVLVAILMNFSLFFVQVAVDVSNYVSYQFFTNVNIEVVENDGVTPVKDREGNPISGKLAAGNQQGLSNVIMNVTRVTALVSSPADLESSGVANGTLNNNQPGFAYGFFAGVLYLSQPWRC